MKIQFLTHADFETPGAIQDWAASRGHAYSFIKPYAGEAIHFADLEKYDFLIVLGGPQSTLNLKESPYLKDEIDYIRQWILRENSF